MKWAKALRATGVDSKNLNGQQIALGKTLETSKEQTSLQANSSAKHKIAA